MNHLRRMESDPRRIGAHRQAAMGCFLPIGRRVRAVFIVRGLISAARVHILSMRRCGVQTHHRSPGAGLVALSCPQWETLNAPR